MDNVGVVPMNIDGQRHTLEQLRIDDPNLVELCLAWNNSWKHDDVGSVDISAFRTCLSHIYDDIRAKDTPESRTMATKYVMQSILGFISPMMGLANAQNDDGAQFTVDQLKVLCMKLIGFRGSEIQIHTTAVKKGEDAINVARALRASQLKECLDMVNRDFSSPGDDSESYYDLFPVLDLVRADIIRANGAMVAASGILKNIIRISNNPEQIDVEEEDITKQQIQSLMSAMSKTNTKCMQDMMKTRTMWYQTTTKYPNYCYVLRLPQYYEGAPQQKFLVLVESTPTRSATEEALLQHGDKLVKVHAPGTVDGVVADPDDMDDDVPNDVKQSIVHISGDSIIVQPCACRRGGGFCCNYFHKIQSGQDPVAKAYREAFKYGVKKIDLRPYRGFVVYDVITFFNSSMCGVAYTSESAGDVDPSVFNIPPGYELFTIHPVGEPNLKIEIVNNTGFEININSPNPDGLQGIGWTDTLKQGAIIDIEYLEYEIVVFGGVKGNEQLCPVADDDDEEDVKEFFDKAEYGFLENEEPDFSDNKLRRDLESKKGRQRGYPDHWAFNTMHCFNVNSKMSRKKVFVPNVTLDPKPPLTNAFRHHGNDHTLTVEEWVQDQTSRINSEFRWNVLFQKGYKPQLVHDEFCKRTLPDQYKLEITHGGILVFQDAILIGDPSVLQSLGLSIPIWLDLRDALVQVPEIMKLQSIRFVECYVGIQTHRVLHSVHNALHALEINKTLQSDYDDWHDLVGPYHVTPSMRNKEWQFVPQKSVYTTTPGFCVHCGLPEFYCEHLRLLNKNKYRQIRRSEYYKPLTSESNANNNIRSIRIFLEMTTGKKYSSGLDFSEPLKIITDLFSAYGIALTTWVDSCHSFETTKSPWISSFGKDDFEAMYTTSDYYITTHIDKIFDPQYEDMKQSESSPLHAEGKLSSWSEAAKNNTFHRLTQEFCSIIGRLQFDPGTYDKYQIFPMILGPGMCGKSVLLEAIGVTFHSQEKGWISCATERVFGQSEIINRKICMCAEAGGDMSGLSEFVKAMTSGDGMSCAVKNKAPIVLDKTSTHLLMMGNETPNFSNTGNAWTRRQATMEMAKSMKGSENDSQLTQKIIQSDMAAFVMRCSTAYCASITQNTSSFWNDTDKHGDVPGSFHRSSENGICSMWWWYWRSSNMEKMDELANFVKALDEKNHMIFAPPERRWISEENKYDSEFYQEGWETQIDEDGCSAFMYMPFLSAVSLTDTSKTRSKAQSFMQQLERHAQSSMSLKHWKRSQYENADFYFKHVFERYHLKIYEGSLRWPPRSNDVHHMKWVIGICSAWEWSEDSLIENVNEIELPSWIPKNQNGIAQLPMKKEIKAMLQDGRREQIHQRRNVPP